MVGVHWEPLISDMLIGVVLLGILFYTVVIRASNSQVDYSRRKLLKTPLSVISAVILGFYLAVCFADSMHFTYAKGSSMNQIHSRVSLLDVVLNPLNDSLEKSFSAPFALSLYGSSGSRLHYVGSQIKTAKDRRNDIYHGVVKATFLAIISSVLVYYLFILIVSFFNKKPFLNSFKVMSNPFHSQLWCVGWMTFLTLSVFFLNAFLLSRYYHILGTDQVGVDVFYMALKSIRTGVLVGVLSTLFMLPFALFMGVAAGYFGRWVDDIIQYIYITISSIPGVLLISAFILVVQVYISHHPSVFPSTIDRADARLILLCMVLGLTSWATLCRILRAETLKIKHLEYIQVSKTLGVSSFRIIVRHIIPNVMHLVVITLVLDFSGLVLSEAVLSYVGVGVDPITFSWGNMINSSRLELSRDPVVWWPLASALFFMFFIVLAANIFADTVREYNDVRLV